MEKTLAQLSTREFEELIERAVDRRLSVWLTQLLDALPGLPEEEDATLRPEFAESLRRSLDQARSGQAIDLKTFRTRLRR